MLRRLSDISLVDVDFNASTYRLHDLIRSTVRACSAATLGSMNAALLDSWQLRSWSDLPADNAYMWEHLAYHLLEAGRPEELARTVQDSRYLLKKAHISGPEAAEADIQRARDVNPEDSALASLLLEWRTVGRQLLLALFRDEADELLRALHNLLQLTAGLSHVSGPSATKYHARITDEARRAKRLIDRYMPSRDGIATRQ